MNIRDIMTTPAQTCRIHDSLSRPAQQMWEHDCGSVPVLDDDEQIVGMITDRDICMSAYTTGRPLSEIRVSDAMSQVVYSCRADESLQSAEELMQSKQVRRVPVVDASNHPVGMLSFGDIARYAARSPRKDGIDRELTETLAAICQPRTGEASSARVSTRGSSTRP